MDELERDYDALHDLGAVWLPRDVVRVSGPDALAFLDGQLSQDINALSAGDAAYSLLLQPQGKVVALLRVQRVDDDAFLLDTDEGWATAVVDRLERFKLRTKATIEHLEGWRCLAVRGRRAGELGTGVAADWGGWSGVDVLGADVEVPAGVSICGHDAYEAARIEFGVPAMGHELTEATIPAEATGVVERSVSFTKGCYTGQELVARVDSRGGNVPRRLFGVELSTQEVPPSGTELRDASGAPVGAITSAARSPRTGGVVALAYIGRKFEPPADIEGGVVKPLPLA
jgi:folate-binding protein YgfZ